MSRRPESGPAARLCGPVVTQLDGDRAERAMARLLVVDDDPGILESMQSLLEILGHEVEAAARWQGVPERIEAWKPGLVLHDHHMPGLDFEHQLRRIRAGAHGSVVPLLIFTGDADAGRDAALMGAQGVLPKPFDPARLEGIVAELLSDAADA